MPICPKCKSKNIEDQKLSVAINKNNPQKPIFKCRDCGEVFRIDKDDVKDKHSQKS